MPAKLDPESDTERVNFNAPGKWIARVDEWRREQTRIPSKSEAIRILVDIALDELAKRKQEKG